MPPELDDIVARAVAFDPADRFPSARALGEAVERYLDGERDQAARRSQASRLAESARAELDASGGDLGARVTAGRTAARALAMDPGNHDAAEVLIRVLGDVSGQVPEEAERAVEQTRLEAEARGVATFGTSVVIFILGLVLVLFAAGIRDPWLAVASIGTGLASGLGLAFTRQGPRQKLWINAWFAVNCVSQAIFCRWTSPWIAVPVAVASNVIFLTLYSTPGDRVLRNMLGVASILVPVGLEELGLISRTFQIGDDSMRIYSLMASLPLWLLILHTISYFVAAATVRATVTNRARELELRLATVSWTLREILGAKRSL